MKMNDRAWQSIFDKYNILEEIQNNGRYVITARQIRPFREPRLMAKFDHQAKLPRPFLENNLAILPISRNDYVISSFSAYQYLPEPTDHFEKVSIPTYLQSLMPQFIVSETIALNCAKVSGILLDFLQDDELVLTVNGRMGSNSFDFYVDTQSGPQKISIDKAQIEIDAAYEGVKYLSLIEAKKGDLSNDFLIRQLYYPFRVWSSRIAKQVKTIFMIYSNGVFNLYEYQFEDIFNYNSLRLVKQKNYMVSTEIFLSDIEDILRKTLVIPDLLDVPFPQADSILRVINLLELLSEGPMSREEITNEYSFVSRQTDYYTDAGRYLGFIKKGRDSQRKTYFMLSSLGSNIMKLDYRNRLLTIIGHILEHKVFNDVLRMSLYAGEIPSIEEIKKIMKEQNLCDVLAESTLHRRASTVSSWINWIFTIISD